MILKEFVEDQYGKWYFEYYKNPEYQENMILLHEGLGSVAQWKDFPQLLQQTLKMNILVYDRSGYGRSSVVYSNYPYDYLRHEARMVLPKIMQYCSISEAHLLGHSDGASIALLAAAYMKEKVLSVISIAAHVIIEKISVIGIRNAKETYTKKLRRPLRKYHGDKTDWVFYHWASTWLDPQFFDWNMIEELKQIQVPVLAVQGELDEYGSSHQLEIIAENCQAQTLLLADCGHHPHQEKTDILLAQAHDFLKGLNINQTGN